MKIRIVKLPPENREWTVIGGRGTFAFNGLVEWSLEDIQRWLLEWCNEWTNLGESDE